MLQPLPFTSEKLCSSLVADGTLGILIQHLEQKPKLRIYELIHDLVSE